MTGTSDLSAPHPRRPPAHLSVSLRHDRRPSGSKASSAEPLPGQRFQANAVAVRRTPGSSNSYSDSSGVKHWFEESNNRHNLQLGQTFGDEEPPYFLPQEDSPNSTSEFDKNGHYYHADRLLAPRIVQAATNGSSTDEYRSVIDDLTIENQKLKERLRKLEGSSRSTPHLEKDRLFEVKFHGLPLKKRRELEETLRVFAASIDTDASTETHSIRVPAKNTRHPKSGEGSHNPSSTSTSNSRPVDSAYASMSTSGPTSTSTSNRVEQKCESQTSNAKEEKVKSFLHNIPKGLLPNHSMVMTERQKKKAVVRRLEQLFTGKIAVTFNENSQPMQQQEVSKSATRADRAADGLSSVEGIREAHILPYEMDVDLSRRRGPLADDSSRETHTSDDSPDDASLDQRPTRPLDLDPDRAQIPSDNVDYIRHLGLSTPQLSKEESHDSSPASTGDWLPLNLLMSMAQLHIINVTPDFVRSALQDVSEMFQLSRDGQNIRWRGGTEGTRLSSDSGASSSRNGSPQDSDSFDEAERKRRKVGGGRFAAAPFQISDPSGRSGVTSSFHYKPLFYHKGSSSEGLSSIDESDSPVERGVGYGSDLATSSRFRRVESHNSSPSSRAKRQGGEGPIIFYSGAPFCTDLSRERGNTTTPRHITGVGKDGFSNHTEDALGYTPRKRPHPSTRTSSGSSIPFRPFKEFSRDPKLLQTEENRSKTPEVLTGSTGDLDFTLDWSSDQSSLDKPLRKLTASGLGGTRPADHFAAKVETRRTILDSSTRAKLSRFSAPGRSRRKFLHAIPKPILDIFQEPQRRESAESISSGLASLNAFGTPPTNSELELPVKIELISAQFSHLEPSPLPAPSGYYAETSTSGDDSDQDSSFSSESRLRKESSVMYRARSFSPLSPNVFKSHHQGLFWRAQGMNDGEKDEKDEDLVERLDEENNSNNDSSIDMLAHARLEGQVQLQQERDDFENEVRRKARPGSSSISVNGESGYSSAESSSGRGDEEMN